MTPKKTSAVLLVLTMLALLATSCRKTDIPRKPQHQHAGKLSKVTWSDGTYDSVYYNQNGTVQRISVHSTVPQPFTERFTFEYEVGDRLERIVSSTGERYEYKYAAGLLTAVAHYAGTEKIDQQVFDYDNGRLSSVEYYHQFAANSPGHELIAERKYSYYPDGNLKREEHFEFEPITRAPRLDIIIDYSNYDNKPNPWGMIERFLYLSTIKFANNNVGKMSVKYTGTGEQSQYVYSYTYNASGVPSTLQSTYTSGTQHYTTAAQFFYY